MAVSWFPPQLECLVHLSICQHVFLAVSTPSDSDCHITQVTPSLSFKSTSNIQTQHTLVTGGGGLVLSFILS